MKRSTTLVSARPGPACRSRRLRPWLAAVAVLALIAASCGGDDASSTTTEAPEATTTTQATTTTSSSIPPEVPLDTSGIPPADYAGFRQQPTACDATPPPEATPQAFTAPEDQGIDPESKPLARIRTSCGDIVIELDPSVAPETVNSFVFLARQGYFDGTAFHRVVPGFVIQGGDPTATGRGGPGYVIPDELPPSGFIYERGTVAMANAGPNTTGSQFFIVLADVPLPPNFSVFGHVVEGLDVLDRIAAVPLGVGRTGEQSTPLQTVYIESVEIENA